MALVVVALWMLVILAAVVAIGWMIRARVDKHCASVEAYYAAIGERQECAAEKAAQILRELVDVRIGIGSLDARLRYITIHLQRVDRERA